MAVPLYDTFNIPTGILASTTSELLLARDTDGDVKLFNGTSYLRGSGTAGYLPVYSTANALMNSILFQSGGNVGIGITTNIDHKLKVGGGIYGDYLQVNTAYSNGNVPGRLSWDADHDLIEAGLNTQFSARLPQDEVWSCIAATNITKGQLVYASGTSGSSGKIQATPFVANGTIPARFLIGIATENAAPGDSFHAMRAGILRGVDTSMYIAGQDLWASITTVGGYQTTIPQAPNQKLSVAFVITSHINVGELSVRINNGFELSGASDVQITSPVTNQLLRYNNNRWENFTHDFARVQTPGTPNRLSKFTGDGRSLGDSIVSEVDGGINISTTSFPALSIYRDLNVNEVGLAGQRIQLGAKFQGVNTAAASITGGLFANGSSGQISFEVLSNNSLVNALLITKDVNILIGTTTDTGHKLQVNGDVRVATMLTGTSTDEVVTVTSSGVLNKRTVSALFSGTNGITGLGTPNRLPKFTGDGRSLSDSVVSEVSGGIAINYPIAILGAEGRGNITINGDSQAILTLGTSGNQRAYLFTDGTNTYLNSSIGFIGLETGGTEKLRVNPNGNILIGTTTDTGHKLQVNGDIRQTSVTNNLVFANSSGVLTAYANTASIALGTGIGGFLTKYTGSGSTQNIGNSLLFESGSNIGLNNTTPIYNLDINGTLGVSNTLSVYSNTSASKVDITTNANGVVSTYTNHAIHNLGTNFFVIGRSSIFTTGAGVGYKTQIDSGTTGGKGLFVNGDIYSTATITSFSDIRLKSELERIENAIDKIKKISGYTYLFNDKRTLGLISQEVKNVAPEAIEEKGGYMTLNYQGFSAVIVEAIKELSNEIQKLKEKCQ